MTFFIKKNSTLPLLEFSLTQALMEKYDISDEMMQNVAVTFSMCDPLNATFRIANKAADLKLVDENDLSELDETCYTLQYCFSEKDTNKTGVFIGEFKLDFLSPFCGKISLPNEQELQIIIQDGITKTTVV